MARHPVTFPGPNSPRPLAANMVPFIAIRTGGASFPMPTNARILKMAVQALRRNVLRSGLTCLGVVIGVATVITMMEIGQGSAHALKQTITGLGASVIQIDPSSSNVGGVSSGKGGKITLTPEDCGALLQECDALQRAAPGVDCRAQIVYGGRNWSPNNILGTTPSFLVIRNWADLAEGEPLTDDDVRSAAPVCLLGQTVARELFDGVPPVGRMVRIKNLDMKVVGVLARKGANMTGRDQDDLVIAPWTTVKFRLAGVRQVMSTANGPASGGGGAVGTVYPGAQTQLYPVPTASQAANQPQMTRFADLDDIWVSATSSGDIPMAMRQITEVLRRRHHLEDGTPDDFRVRDLTEISTAMGSTSRLMANLLLTVALISLVVGGVGIMNIMLVSVTERTKEIGLRMAVGARARDILSQFLVEAILLCMAGGILGIGLGKGASYVVTTFFRWPTIASMPAVVAAVGVSVAVGICFGFYPAWKASRLDPIEALRHE